MWQRERKSKEGERRSRAQGVGLGGASFGTKVFDDGEGANGYEGEVPYASSSVEKKQGGSGVGAQTTYGEGELRLLRLSIHPSPDRLLQPPMLDVGRIRPEEIEHGGGSLVGGLGFEKKVTGSGLRMEEKHGSLRHDDDGAGNSMEVVRRSRGRCEMNVTLAPSA